MSKLQKTKVCYDLADMWPIILTFLVVGIGATYGLSTLYDVKDDLCTYGVDTTGTKCLNSTGGTGTGAPESVAFNATASAELGVAKFPTKLATIAGIAVAAIIIGVVVRAFQMRQ